MQASNIYSCLLTVKFGFSINSVSGKESAPQQVYSLSTQALAKVGGVEDDYPYEVIDTRVRVRGSGKVMVMRYESEDGKDFQLIGRVTPYTFETEG